MAIVAALLSSAMYGIADFLGGKYSKRLPVTFVVGVSQFFGLLTAIAVAMATHSAWDSRAIPHAMLASVAGFLGLMMFYQALATGRMGIVSPIASLGVLVPLGVGLVHGEIPRAVQIIGIILAIVGIVLASGPELSGASDSRPVFLAVGAAVGFGTCFVFIADGSYYSVATTMIVMRLQTVPIAIVIALLTKSFAKPSRKEVGWLAVIGALDNGANLAMGYATTLGMLTIVSVLASLYPVVTVLLAWWLLRERLLVVQYVGIATALLGVCAITAG